MFGKKETIKLDKLKEGYTFKLFKTVWTVLAIGEYDWRGDGRSIEYTIGSSSTEKAYLEVEFLKDDYEIYYSEQVSIDFALLQDALVSKSIIYNSKEFSLEEHYKGAYKNLSEHSSWEHLESSLFYSEDEDILTIEKWEDDSLEVFFGEEVSSKKIKNITTI